MVLTLVAAAIAGLFLVTGIVRPRDAFFEIDGGLLLLLFALLIAVEILRASGYLDRLVQHTMMRFRTTRSFGFAMVLFSGVLAMFVTKVISNVPATVLLGGFIDTSWVELLYGVSAGGCGTIIASLANLPGWRIYVRESNHDPRFFRRFTAINFVFLAWAAGGGWLILSLSSRL